MWMTAREQGLIQAANRRKDVAADRFDVACTWGDISRAEDTVYRMVLLWDAAYRSRRVRKAIDTSPVRG